MARGWGATPYIPRIGEVCYDISSERNHMGRGMVSEVKGSPERSAKADSPPYMRSVGLIDSSGRSTRQMLVAATGSGQHNDRTRGEWRAPNFATQGRVELVASGSHLLVALLVAL